MRFLANSFLVLMILAACGSEKAPEFVPTPIGSSEGQRLFFEKGCAACHGSKQEGSLIAPSLIGITADQLKRQVRGPLGAMPVFPPSRISDRELDEIAQFVESRENGYIFDQTNSTGEESFQMHWMALSSLADNSPEEAIQHVDDLIEQVTGPHRFHMIQIRTEIQTGNYHTAVHSLEDMVPGIKAGELSFLGIYIGLARNAASIGDIQTTTHHVDHALGSVYADKNPFETQLRNIQDQLEIGNIANAVRELEELIDR